jgi:hypothetical protein
MPETSAAEHGGIVFSRNWLAIFGTLVAVAMTLGNWAISQQTSRSTMSLQLQQLERRLDGYDARGETRRASTDATFANLNERLQHLSDRLARLEARLDANPPAYPQRNGRASDFEVSPFCEDGAVRLERAGWTLPRQN